MAEMTTLLNRVKDESEQLGLRLNVTIDQGDPLMADGQKVEFVSQFNFLGSLIRKEGGCGQEIRHRLAMAR